LAVWDSHDRERSFRGNEARVLSSSPQQEPYCRQSLPPKQLKECISLALLHPSMEPINEYLISSNDVLIYVLMDRLKTQQFMFMSKKYINALPIHDLGYVATSSLSP
jgi:hypothetical protein